MDIVSYVSKSRIEQKKTSTSGLDFSRRCQSSEILLKLILTLIQNTNASTQCGEVWKKKIILMQCSVDEKASIWT